MTDQELKDESKILAFLTVTGYTGQQIDDALAGKSSAELQTYYDRAKKACAHLEPSE